MSRAGRSAEHRRDPVPVGPLDLDRVTWKRSDPLLTWFVDHRRDGRDYCAFGARPDRRLRTEWLGEQAEDTRRQPKTEIVVSICQRRMLPASAPALRQVGVDIVTW